MISADHPYFFLHPVMQKESTTFHLSKYEYNADSLFDRREFLTVSGSELTCGWVDHTIETLSAKQELAIHSLVKINGRSWHIPMIDFSIDEPLAGPVFDRMRLFLPKSVFLNIGIFESGRSYHAYSTSLLSPKEWIDFMGRILLINPRHGKEIVDSRWVGHRIMGGFSSLRWSANTQQYVGIPKRVNLQSLV